MSEETKNIITEEGLYNKFIDNKENKEFLERLSEYNKKEGERIEEENQKKINEAKAKKSKKEINDKIKKVLIKIASVKEEKNRNSNAKMAPEYPITFMPINTCNRTKELINNYFEILEEEKTGELLEEYFDLKMEEKNREIIIDDLHLDDLKCNFTIDNIEYTFIFTEDKICMTNNSTGEELETDYNLDICSLIFKFMNNEDSIIYKKNKNNISIAILMLRNSIDKGVEKGSLIYELEQYINNSSKIAINKLFVTTICESGNLELFKYFFLNYKELFNDSMLAAAAFSGNAEIFHTLNREGYKVNFNTLKQGCSGNDVGMVEYLMDNYCKNFELNNRIKISELFENIKNPEIGLYIVDDFIEKLSESIKDDQETFLLILDQMRKYDEKVASFKPKPINGKIMTDDKLKLFYFNSLKKYNETRKYEEMDRDRLVKLYLYSTLFLRVIKNDHLEMFYFLIKEIERKLIEIDVNIEEDQTPLYYAVYNENIEIIKNLLSFEDIEIDLKNKINGETLLHIAAKNKNPKIIKALLAYKGIDAYYNINERDKNSLTPLHYAVINENTKVIKILLSNKNIDVNVKDKDEQTPLYHAARNENPEVVKALLSNKNIKVNIKNDYGTSPLQVAVINNKNPEVVKALLSHKDIDVNIINGDKDTLLHIAASYERDPEIAKALINHGGIDINAKNERGQTPLQVASSWKNIGVIKILLSCENIKIEDRLMRQLLRCRGIENELRDYMDRQKKLNDKNTNGIFNNAIKEISNIPNQQNNLSIGESKG